MTPDVLVIGAGVVGLSVAYEAARKGLRVTVVDAGPATGGGCSWGNAGMIVPSHFTPLAAPGMVALGLRCLGDRQSPFALRPRLDGELWRWCWRFFRAANARHAARAAPLLRDLHLASRELYREWDGAWGGGFDLQLRGLLMLCKTEHALDEERRTAGAALRLGLAAEVLGPRELGELEPGLRFDVAGGVYFPHDAHLDPARLMTALAKRVREAGVTLSYETPALGWRVIGQRVAAVRTERGELAAGEFVLSAGARSALLARSLGLTLPVQAGKGYSLTLATPRARPRLGVILVEARVALTPMGSGLRVGGTLELAGHDEHIDPLRVRGIVTAVPRYLPDFSDGDFVRARPWCGLRPCSPDGLPYVGRFARFANLTSATGHAMMGVSLGPITGRLVAELLVGQRPSLPLADLSPDRHA